MTFDPTTLRRSAAVLATVIILACATPARAQLAQICFALNESAPGTEYLSVSPKTGLEGNAAYTIEAWIHPASFSNYPCIVGNDYTQSFWLGLNTAGQVRFYPRGGIGQYVDTGNTVPLNRWTHVAAVYNSATGYSIYLNGQLESTGNSITGAVGTSAGDLRIGADRESGLPDYYWRGYLDEVRIWSTARNAAQIGETMYAGVGRPSSFASGVYNGLKATWSVEGTLTTGTSDLGESPNNFATFVNGNYASHTSYDIPFGPPVAPNQALQLNGVNDRVVLPVTENFGRGVTVMAWVAPTNDGSYPTIVGRDFTSSFWFGVTPGGRLRFYPTGGTPVDGVTPIYTTGRWTHVAATYANGRTVLYIDGQVDRISEAVSGPVGANGRDVWVGADNGGYGLGYPFAGWLDEVKVIQGALDAASIRRQMFSGYPQWVSPLSINDKDGVPVSMCHVNFDNYEAFAVLGSGARLVRGGTAAAQNGFMGILTRPLEQYATSVIGGLALPNDDASFTVSTDIFWQLNPLVTDVDVFVSAPLTDLANTEITLRSPAGTVVNLLSFGDAIGRDLLTVFDDAAFWTWATGSSPFHDGVRPSQPLSTFAGENAQGLWRIYLGRASGSPARVGLWAWGLRINNATLDVPDGGAGREVALRLAGTNPVSGSGALAFDLPRAARVELALHDLQGRRVLPILSGERPAGSYRFGFSTRDLATGVYFARLVVDGKASRRAKITVVR